MNRSFATIASLVGLLGALAAFALALAGSDEDANTTPSTAAFSDAHVPTGAYAISADFKTLAQFNDGAIEIVSLPSREVTRRLPLPEGKCHAVVMSDDKRWLAAVLSKASVVVWDLKAVPQESPIELTQPAYALRFLPRWNWLAAYSNDRPVVWNVGQRPPVRVELKHVPESNAVFSRSGEFAAYWTYPGTIVVSDAQQEISRYRGGPQDQFRPLSFSPDSQTLAVRGQLLHLWRFRRKEMDSYNVHNADFAAFSPDGRRLYVAGMGMHAYDAQSMNHIATAWSHARLANFMTSADGRQFSFRDRGFLYFRDIEQVLAHRLTRAEIQSGKTWWPAACEPITRWPEFQAASPYPLRALPNFDPMQRHNSEPFAPSEEQTDSYSMKANPADVLPRALKTLEQRFNARPHDCTIAYVGHRLYRLSEFTHWARPTTRRFGADAPLVVEMEKRGSLAPILCIDFWGHFMPAHVLPPRDGRTRRIDPYVRVQRRPSW